MRPKADGINSISRLSRWRFFSSVIGVTLCCASLYLLFRERRDLAIQPDEAYIHYRYAANWLGGKGLVFNPGEYVEAMPSLLFTMLVALGMGLGFDAAFVGHTLCLGFALITLTLTFYYSRNKLPAEWVWFAGIAPLVVLASSYFALWSGSGMETLLWTSAVLAALIAVQRERIEIAAIAAFVATLIHIEGLLVAIAIFGDALIKSKGVGRRIWLWLGVYSAGFCGLTLFRLIYYGSLLPNWLYAVGGLSVTTAITTFYNFILSGPILLLVPAIYSGAERRDHDGALFFLGLLTLFLLLIGGDALDYSPLLTSALPVIAVLAIHGCVTAWNSQRTLGMSMMLCVAATIVYQYLGSSSHYVLYLAIAGSLAAVFFQARSDSGWLSGLYAVGLAICALLLITPPPLKISQLYTIQGRCSRSDRMAEIQYRMRLDYGKADRRISLFTKETTDPLIATAKIGRLGYKKGYRIIDLCGRTQKAITRVSIHSEPIRPVLFIYQSGDIQYVIRRKPDFVVASKLLNDQYPAVKQAISDPEFNRLYQFDGSLFAYHRRSKPRLDPKEVKKRLREPPKRFNPEARPNIVLLTIDTLRADHLEMYGYFRKTAPSISRLANQGVLFTKAYSTAPWTIPSLVSIFTSLYPSQHGVVQIESVMGDEYKTITERLKEVGYTTIGLVSNTLSSRLRGFNQGFDYFDESQIVFIEVPTSKNLTKNAIELLIANEREPFFLWVHYFDPHFSYLRHPQYGFANGYVGFFGEKIEVSEILALQSGVGNKVKSLLKPEDIEYIRSVYDEEIAFTDAAIGSLTNQIEQMGFSRPTVTIVTADHGENFGERDLFGHDKFVYDTLVHIPLVIKSSLKGDTDKAIAGSVITAPVSNRNIAVTIMDLAEITQHDYRGVNLFDIARGKAKKTETFTEGNCAWTKCGKRLALVSGDWKLIENPKTGKSKRKTYELYNLSNDPKELNNLWLARDIATQESKRGLLKEIRKFSQRARRESSKINLTEQQKKKLESLGYIR